MSAMLSPEKTAPAHVQGAMPREYLSFKLGAEEYGIDILKVQEIRGYEQPTRIANAPVFIKGVVNLRGTIVPIVDLRIRFHLMGIPGSRLEQIHAQCPVRRGKPRVESVHLL